MREQRWAPGSVAVLDSMVRPGGPPVSAEAKLIYLALFSYMGNDYTCHPAVATLAKGTGLSARTVKRRLPELEHAGLVKRAIGGGRKSTRYALQPPWQAEAGQAGTGDTQTPVTERHQAQTDTPAVPGGHGSEAPVTPEVTHRSEPNASNPMPIQEEEGAIALWQEALATLGRITDAWMAKTTPAVGPAGLVVEVPGTFARDRAESRYGHTLRESLATIAGWPVGLEFVVKK